MGNQYSSYGYCSVEDNNKNNYILTDKNKQPLYCFSNNEQDKDKLTQGTCKKDNFKKYLDNPALLNGEIIDEKFFLNKVAEDQFIPCSSPHTKPNILFGNPTNPDNSLPKISVPIPKSKINFNSYDIAYVNIAAFAKDSKKEQINLNGNIIDIFKATNNNLQNTLIREDTRKIDPTAPPPAQDSTQIDYKIIAIVGSIAFVVLLLFLGILFR